LPSPVILRLVRVETEDNSEGIAAGTPGKVSIMLLMFPLESQLTPLQPHGFASFIQPAPERAPLLAELEDPAESKIAFMAQNWVAGPAFALEGAPLNAEKQVSQG